MNPNLLLTLVAGLLVGLGLAIVVSALGRGYPVLADALAALDERTARPRQPARRSLLPALDLVPGRVPTADLELLGWTRERFLLGRAGAAAAYCAAGPLLAAVLVVLDVGISIVIPAGFMLAGAIVGWTGYARRVEERAAAAREELRFALVSYLQQVSLLRRGGAGVATALTTPARLLDDGWAMRRIGDELDLAERSGEMPWDGLRRFGERIEVPDLVDLSSIAATAGHDGGAVIDTLLARAESLHDELLADEHADAHRASGQMSTPGALQVFLISAWVLYPAGTALLSL